MNDPVTAVRNPTPTEIRPLSSTYVGQEYRLFISVPASYATSDTVYPVLYLLDGNLTYPLVRPIVEILQVAEAVPEVILVGIGYPTATYMETATL
jgi:uncharacterized protein